MNEQLSVSTQGPGFTRLSGAINRVEVTLWEHRDAPHQRRIALELIGS